MKQERVKRIPRYDFFKIKTVFSARENDKNGKKSTFFTRTALTLKCISGILALLYFSKPIFILLIFLALKQGIFRFRF